MKHVEKDFHDETTRAFYPTEKERARIKIKEVFGRGLAVALVTLPFAIRSIPQVSHAEVLKALNGRGGPEYQDGFDGRGFIARSGLGTSLMNTVDTNPTGND